MGQKTKIQWCDDTINWWSGCTRVSSGCRFCYAEKMDNRHLIEPVSHWGKGAPRLEGKGAVKLAHSLNRKPLVCDDCGEAGRFAPESYALRDCICDGKKFHRRRIFTLSRGDMFDDEVPIEMFITAMDTIRKCNEVIWIICTKRPELFKPRMTELLKRIENTPETSDRTNLWNWCLNWTTSLTGEGSPKNICMLTSVENQAMADLRIPRLLDIPTRWHGLSMEPLLEPVKLSLNTINVKVEWPAKQFPVVENVKWSHANSIDWIITGCESGPKRRECNIGWITAITNQAANAGIPMFVKQIQDSEGMVCGDVNEFPEHLQIQQWPAGF